MVDKWCQLMSREAVAEAIRHLNEEELRFLNRLIVERLKLIGQARSTALMARFSVGDRVSFPCPVGEAKTGIILRLNKKTATIGTDDGQQWNVYPGFLTPAGQTGTIQPKGGGQG
jgi:hypothetical protein